MKIKQKILDKVDNPRTRMRIAAKLNLTEQAVAVQFRKNRDNGRLTKMDALRAISEECGLSVDQILVEKEKLV